MGTMKVFIEWALYSGVVLSWAVNIFFLARFAREWYLAEPEPRRAWLALALVCVPAFVLTLFVVPRGGYDNNHDFMSLGTRFFGLNPGQVLEFKEAAPLFTDWVSDIVSGYSLNAILWKNRLLFAGSAFLFFAGLRRLGIGIAVAAASAAFLFLNFLSVINASTFCTTASNLFIWFVSLAALFDVYGRAHIDSGRLLWIFSSMTLVVNARYEFLPVNLLIFAALMAYKLKTRAKDLLNLRSLGLAVLFAALLVAWGSHNALAPRGADPFAQGPVVLTNPFYHLWSHNFAVIAGALPKIAMDIADSRYMVDSAVSLKAVLFISFCFILMSLGVLGGALADKNRRIRNIWFFSVLCVWSGFFSFIYLPMDWYPLQFMRHHLYFLVPFAYLLALALDGARELLRGAPCRVKAVLLFTGVALLAAYAAVNAAAALRLNGQLRTNDIELAFLAGSRKDWPENCRVYHPHDQEHRTGLLKKYFPFVTPFAQEEAPCLLRYVSAPPQIFYDVANPLAAPAAPKGAPWRTLSFKHAFYTNNFNNGPRRERVVPVPVTIGFFKMSVLELAGLDSGYTGKAGGNFDLRAGTALIEQAAVPGGKPAAAPAPIYDAGRDAGKDIAAAVALAAASHKRVMVFVGGYWCVWSVELEKFCAATPEIMEFRDKNYVSVKVFHSPSRSAPPGPLAGYPKIAGYPHIYVLDSGGKMLCSQDTAQLEGADGYSRDKFMAFLRQWAPPAAGR